eukprot:6214000-Pleurochrysis_carterae.AAC.3
MLGNMYQAVVPAWQERGSTSSNGGGTRINRRRNGINISPRNGIRIPLRNIEDTRIFTTNTQAAAKEAYNAVKKKALKRMNAFLEIYENPTPEALRAARVFGFTRVSRNPRTRKWNVYRPSSNASDSDFE